MSKINSCSEAKEKGLQKYFTGKPCKHGGTYLSDILIIVVVLNAPLLAVKSIAKQRNIRKQEGLDTKKITRTI